MIGKVEIFAVGNHAEIVLSEDQIHRLSEAITYGVLNNYNKWLNEACDKFTASLDSSDFYNHMKDSIKKENEKWIRRFIETPWIACGPTPPTPTSG